MPPKVKITKEDIIDTAVDIVRNSGAEAINARNIAAVLNCSTQPVFSNFSTMEELRLAVVEKADMLCQEYITEEIERGEFPEYKASGMAYIRFAKEEKELFKLLYMRDRSKETAPKESKLNDEMNDIVCKNTGLSEDEAKLFHFEMWAFVHGIAVMLATDYIELNLELASKMLTDAYQGLRKSYNLG
jgi:AcrR family transcriptional regulator